MSSKLVPFALIFLLVVGTVETGWGEDRPVTHELYLHGINDNARSNKPAVRHRVENAGGPGLIYNPEGTRKIRVELILPSQKPPSMLTDTLIYKDNRSRDLALERMDPLYAARLRGIEPQIIAPTMPGEGRFSWENNARIVEGWIRTLGSGKTSINILGNSQAAPIVATVLAEPKNYGLVNKVVMIDAALGSPWPTVRQKLKAIPEIPGVMPRISDALKDNKLGSEALQKVFARLPQVDPGTDWTFLNTKSGVVSQPMMEKVVATLQGAGIKAKLNDDHRLLYMTPEPPAGSRPGPNKGFIHSNPVPEITGRGPHGAGQFLQYANFDTLFKGWTLKGLTGDLGKGFGVEGLHPPLRADTIGLGTGTPFGDLTKGVDFTKVDKIRLNSESIDLGKTNWVDNSSQSKFKDVDIKIDIRIK